MKTIFLTAAMFSCVVSSFALRPVREYKVTPADYGMTYEEVNIVTDDKLNLKGWFFKPMSESKKAVIISDDGDGNMSDNLELVAQFLSLGYYVLTYDYRGFGKSDDFEINPKFYIYPQFVKDVMGAIDYMQKYRATLNLDVYGIGMGAGLTLSVAANKPWVRRVIADAPYINFEMMRARLKDKKDVDVIMPTVYDKYFMEPQYALQSKGTHFYGVMYIAGENDVLVSPADIKNLMKLNKKSYLYMVKGATNTENFTSNKNKYFEEIRKFVEQQ